MIEMRFSVHLKDQIGMPLLGPFTPSTQEKRWIVVATDYLRRDAEAKALPLGTAVEVAKFLVQSIVLRHAMLVISNIRFRMFGKELGRD